MATIVLIPVNSALGTESAEFVVLADAFPTMYLVGNAANKNVTDNDRVRVLRKCAAGYFTPVRDVTGNDKGEVWLGVGTFKVKLISGTVGVELE